MKEQLALQQTLRKKLYEIQLANPRFSLRAYSKRIGINAGALSLIMNGKRTVSKDLAERITLKLIPDPQERADLLSLFPEKRRMELTVEEAVYEARYLALSAAQFRMIAEWEHYALLSLMNCSDFQSDQEWIARRLGVSTHRVSEVMSRLLELGLIRRTDDGALLRDTKSVRTSDDIVDLSLRKCYEENLDLAKNALNEREIDERDFSTITMAIDPSKMAIAKERIRRFQDELSDLMETGNRSEVYRLSMQLFPLTQKRKEN